MAWNDAASHRPLQPGAHRPQRLSLLCAMAACLVGCSVSGPRESPVLAVTRGSATVVDIYRAQGRLADTPGDSATQERQTTPRERMQTVAYARPIAPGDGDTQRNWSVLEPLRQRFARVPNPELVMVVFPHLAKGQYPVPGYVTVFPMYEQANLYALPGEVAEDLDERRSAFGPAPERSARPPRTTP